MLVDVGRREIVGVVSARAHQVASVYTGAFVLAEVDLALSLVEKDHGAEPARQIAR